MASCCHCVELMLNFCAISLSEKIAMLQEEVEVGNYTKDSLFLLRQLFMPPPLHMYPRLAVKCGSEVRPKTDKRRCIFAYTLAPA